MNRSHFWKLLLILFVLSWAIYEMTPLKGRDLMVYFQERAQGKDETFSSIVARAQELELETPGRTFGNLLDAVGTNRIAGYFPHIRVQGEQEPNIYILHRLQRESSGQIKLGLDLQGGSAFTVEMKEDPSLTNEVAETEERREALSQAIEVLRKRVDKLGVAEPVLQPVGDNRILIQLPGLSEATMQSARETIQKAAFLEFRMVHPSNLVYLAQGIVPPGYVVLNETVKRDDGTKALQPTLVSRRAERDLTGKYLTRAIVTRQDLTNEPEIQFELNTEGAQLFGDITRQYKPVELPNGQIFRYQLAIVLDGELYSAPAIQSPIEGGRGVITGVGDLAEARTLANVLENPLGRPVEIVQESTVSPTLGVASIQSGIKAAVIGLIAVSVFMLVYYMFSGLVANVALLLNMIILMGVLCSLDATLTLPGIAGIVLTMGMAVDANVLIYERIREELKAGKSMKGAISAGYSKAFGTIFDSNITTLISAVILYNMGTGPVKGFGLTLMVGIITSMGTALIVTRLIFDFMLHKMGLKALPMLHIIRGAKIDFLRWAVPAFIASWLLISVGVGYGFYRGNDVLGVDFAGGQDMTLSFADKVEIGQLRPVVEKLGVGSAFLGYQRDMSTGLETLRVTTRLQGDQQDGSERILGAFQQNYPQANFKRESLETVGASVGAEIQQTAVVALLLALGGILLYVAFRYEISFAVGAVLAIVHDVLMTLGWFCLTGRELNAPMVAALLTIIGFSINDTIVIFDRIREDLRLGAHGSFKDVINRALNETLSRTIITSGTTLFAALSLFVFGGGSINDFAFTMVVGVIAGTYSTIYIASALVLWWHKGARPKASNQVLMDNTAAPIEAH